MPKQLPFRGQVDEEILEDLYSKFRKERVKKFVRALSHGGFQNLESDIFDVYVSSSLGAAQGDTLKQWGSFVGEPKRQLTDGEYRRIIHAKLQARNTADSSPELTQVYETALDAFDVLRVGAYPAAFVLTAIVPEMPDEYYSSRVRDVMETAKGENAIGMVLKVAFPDYIAFGSEIEGGTTARVL